MIEELEEVFHDAHDNYVQTVANPRMTAKRLTVDFGLLQKQIEEEKSGGNGLFQIYSATEDFEPWNFTKREQLPFFKDPKVKISIWTVLKDSIGKDLSKITMPVYFNQPLSLL